MTQTVKKKNAQKSRRKVQSSSARNRKSVSRPIHEKKLVEEKKSVKTEIVAIVPVEETKVEPVVEEKKAELVVEKKKAELMVEKKKAELMVEEKKAEPAARKTNSLEEAIEEKQIIKKDVKVQFINENVEKRPLGVVSDEKRRETQIQHFADSSFTAMLPDIVEQVSRREEEASYRQAARTSYGERILSGDRMPRAARSIDGFSRERVRNVDGILPRPKASEIKENEIRKAVRTTNSTVKKSKSNRNYRVNFGFKRILLALACASAAVFAIVYFVDLNAPNISLKVAAMQVGIDATYPSYVPRDYNLSDITAENGKVTINFKNPNTEDSFSVTEESSSWDSTALLNNYVRDEYGDEYTTIREQGLTLYMDGRSACWVNGGVMFKIKVTSGSLTKKQITTIAKSL